MSDVDFLFADVATHVEAYVQDLWQPRDQNVRPKVQWFLIKVDCIGCILPHLNKERMATQMKTTNVYTILHIYIYIRIKIYMYMIVHTSRCYVRNYVRIVIVFQGGDHSKKVNLQKYLFSSAQKSSHAALCLPSRLSLAAAGCLFV